jgi:hypothetical protein
MLGLLFGPEDETDICHRNVGCLPSAYMAFYSRRYNSSSGGNFLLGSFEEIIPSFLCM